MSRILKATSTRKFTGQLKANPESRDREQVKYEQHFLDRQLRAYLKGKELMNFGFTDKMNLQGLMERVPMQWRVMQEWR